MVYARVLYLNQVTNNWDSALNIEMVMTLNHKTEQALIDSGATENFIDLQTIEWLLLLIRKLQQPRVIYNIDGTFNQAESIMHKCQLKIKFKDLTKKIDFYVTSLGQDWIVLGFPFLQEFNPEIDWRAKTILLTKQIFITPQPL
jgi:hypothetical protein